MNAQIEKLLEVAKSYVGYLEKKSNQQLEDFTANAGSGNWTIFGQWYKMNAQPWCAMFVSFVADKAEISTDIIPKHASCTVGISWFKQHGRWHERTGYTPQKGDIVYFTHDGKSAAHVGIVYAVEPYRVHTVEGNTSGGSTLVENGGGVALKSYPRTYDKILGYGNPAYEDDVAKYKATIQEHCKFTDPNGVWMLMDKHVYKTALYKQWADSYK